MSHLIRATGAFTITCGVRCRSTDTHPTSRSEWSEAYTFHSLHGACSVHCRSRDLVLTCAREMSPWSGLNVTTVAEEPQHDKTRPSTSQRRASAYHVNEGHQSQQETRRALRTSRASFHTRVLHASQVPKSSRQDLHWRPSMSRDHGRKAFPVVDRTTSGTDSEVISGICVEVRSLRGRSPLAHWSSVAESPIRDGKRRGPR